MNIVKFGKMKKLIEIPMKKSIKKRVTLYKDGKRKDFYMTKLLVELFTPDELREIPKNVEESEETSLLGTSL
jgi:hypothetical protein